MYKRHHCISALFLFSGFTSAQAATTLYHSEADFFSALGVRRLAYLRSAVVQLFIRARDQVCQAVAWVKKLVLNAKP